MENAEFRETQRFPWWMTAFTLPATFLFGAIAVAQLGFGHRVGSKPVSDAVVLILFAVVGIGLPLFVSRLRSVVESDADGLRIRVVPVYRKKVFFSDIAACRVIPVRALEDFGGWGLRMRNGKTAVIMGDAKEAVEITASRGKTYVLAVQDTKALAELLRRKCGFGPEA